MFIRQKLQKIFPVENKDLVVVFLVMNVRKKHTKLILSFFISIKLNISIP